ncbi:hypothetical protein [Yoonia vestfoldensis]|uniref:hypothetical protein n=1 Tax=Yoonia vestfoldensis TaxID=245188 RepID=UPI00036D6ECF|nr:hypothetical protein [Yoonia vestfoldensis]
MAQPWAWIGGATSLGLIAAGLWLGTIEQETPAIGPADVPPPTATPAPAPPAAPEPAVTPEPEPVVSEPAPPPVVPLAGGVWLYAPDAGLSAEGAEDAMRLVAQVSWQAKHFGAVAIPRAFPDSQYVIEGYGELAQAENHALNICAQTERDCIILAWLVPPDWDGTFEGTLNARQKSLFHAFTADRTGRFLAFASSPEGAAGHGAGASPDEAAEAAMLACRLMQHRQWQGHPRRRGCAVMATRQVDP